jgi:hypothetical protein
MRVRIFGVFGLVFGFLALAAACGGSRFKVSAYTAAKFLKELQGGQGTVPARLMLFEGDTPPRDSKVVGALQLIEREVRFEVTPSGQANRIERDLTTGSFPVIETVKGPEGLFLSAYLGVQASRLIEQPRREDPPVWYSPTVNYCARYRFLGNDRLSRPFFCSPDAIFCVIPRPTEVPCELDSAAQTVCGGYYPVPFNPDAILKKTIANHLFMVGEPRAFECIRTQVGHPVTYEFRNFRELRMLRVELDGAPVPLDFNWGS